MISFFSRQHSQEIPDRTKRLEELCVKIFKQTDKNDKLLQLMAEYDVPTVDVYIELKMSLSRLEKREEVMLRQKNIEILKKRNQKALARKEIKEFRPSSKLARRPTKYTTIPGKVFHGKTYNIVYSEDLVKEIVDSK